MWALSLHRRDVSCEKMSCLRSPGLEKPGAADDDRAPSTEPARGSKDAAPAESRLFEGSGSLSTDDEMQRERKKKKKKDKKKKPKEKDKKKVKKRQKAKAAK